MVEIKTKIEGVKEKREELTSFRKHLGFLEVPLRKCVEIVRGIFAQQFGSEGSYLGGGWTPLKEATKKQRVRMGFGEGPILFRSGELFRSFTSPTSSGHYTVIGPTSAEVGSILKTPKGAYNLGAIHHYGAPKAGIPIRSIMDPDGALPSDKEEEIVSILNSHIDTWFEGHPQQ